MTNYPYSPDNNITLPTVTIRTQVPVVDGSSAGGDLGGTYPNPSVVNIQGNPVLASGANQPTINQVLQWNGLAWVPGSGGGGSSFVAGRDLAGSNTLQTVIGLQTRRLSAAAPSVGQVIAWNGTQWAPATPVSGGSAGGDLSGSYPNPVVAKLQGTTLSVSSPSSGQFITYNGSAWVSSFFTGAAGGDLSGSYPNPTVSKLQNRNVLSTAPSSGQVLTWNGAAWGPGSATTFVAGGDLTGSNTNQTVISINGATIPVSGTLTPGNVLQVSGGSALTYAPVNLAGGANFVTAILPAANLPIATTIALGVIKLAGDLGGTDVLPSVLKVHGSSIPAGGSLTSGNVLQVSGSSSLTYTTINLANSSSVSGTLAASPSITSITPSKGEFVIATSSSAYQPFTISGDVAASVVTPGDLTVVGIQKTPIPTPVGSVVDGYDTVLTYDGINLSWATVGGGTYPTGPALGDLGGSYPAPKVVGLQTYPIHFQVLGGIDDGYVLTFGSDGYWSAAPPVSGGAGLTVQTGYNYGKSLTIYPFPGVTTTNSTTFVKAGTFEFDPTTITAANGARSIILRVVAETTTPLMTIQLYNQTAASVVTGSTLTTSSVTPVLLPTGDLTANLTNGPAIYQVQIKMAAGGISDQVTLDMATLKITWS